MKPFECSDYGMKFSRSSNMKSHQRSKHTFEKPFECNHCDVKFNRNSNLKLR